MRRLARLAWALAVSLPLAAPLAAQSAEQAVLLEDYERLHSNVLKYVDAMPDSALGFRPTPGVRTFAEQIEHIVMAHMIGASTAATEPHAPPPLGDKSVYLKDKAALKAAVDSGFNHAMAMIRGLTPESAAREVRLFGDTHSAIRWFRTMHEHGAWTLGQTVPYLRLNGVTPPGYMAF